MELGQVRGATPEAEMFVTIDQHQEGRQEAYCEEAAAGRNTNHEVPRSLILFGRCRDNRPTL